MTCWTCVGWVVFSMLLAGSTRAAGDALQLHPMHEELGRIFAIQPPADFKPTGVTRADYLKLMGANLDFFRKYQNESGAIIDPVSKGERQYSTPAFAAAAALLVKEAKRQDQLEPATKAMNHSLTALVEKRAADWHPDFYIPMLVHAYRLLKDVVPPEQSAAWAKQFRSIEPEKIYRMDLRGMNWNIVSSCGELLRRKDALVAEPRRAAQMKYLEECLSGHLKTLTPLGLFEDPGAPMTYDAFSRLWLEDVFANDAYQGVHAKRIESFLRTGGLSTLLLLSPTGEWACGGRSGLHNWADVQILAICEINAAHWKKQGRDDVAGAFKRAAHLAFQSVSRWQRPSGELWIIKNRAEPEQRLAYERYSNHSQYNLLPMAMLAMAYGHADESIAERPSPAEVGGYVFDARDTFHKVAAAAGGYYVLIDCVADAEYNATGLQRVHKAGVAFSAISDSAAPERVYGPGDAPKKAIAPGIAWKRKGEDQWLSLADFSGGTKAKRSVQSADLQVRSTSADKTEFQINYKLTDERQGRWQVTDRYMLTNKGVELTANVTGDAAAYAAHWPVLVSDGAADTQVQTTASGVSISQRGSMTSVRIADAGVSEPLALKGPRVVNHNGYVQEALVGVKSKPVTMTIELSAQ